MRHLSEALMELIALRRTDLRAGYAYPVPIKVISELIGVPEHPDAAIHACVDGFFDGSFTPEQSAANYLEIRIRGPT